MSLKDDIKKKFDCTLSEFAEQNDIDFDTLNNFLSGKTKGSREGTKAHKVKNLLIEKGLQKEEPVVLKKINIDYSKIKYPFVKAYYEFEIDRLQKIEHNEDEIDGTLRKKLPLVLKLFFNIDVKDYILQNKLLKSKKITATDFGIYVHGGSNGNRPGTKASYIKKALHDEGIIPIIVYQ